MKTESKKAKIPESRTVEMQPNTYQPAKAEKEEEADMPGADIDTVRSAFFRRIEPKEPMR